MDLLFKNDLKNKMILRNTFLVLILFFISFIPIIDFFNPGLPLTHDGQDHVARISNFYQNLLDGNIIPRWAPNLNWGYGHPILMFLYPLPSYVASLFHFLGFSLVDSVKLVFAVAFVASAMTMFLWTRNIFGIYGGFIASILYTYAPYRFVDLYVRGAIGEHVAFVFGPLVCYFLFKLSQKNSIWYLSGGALSLAALILSHNAISLMFFPFICMYAIWLLLQEKNKSLLAKSFFGIFAFGFGLASFFWIPAYVEGKYTLRDIVTSKEYSSRFVEFSQFLYGTWSYGGSADLSKQVGIIHWVFIAASFPLIFILKKKKEKDWIVLMIFLVFFSVSLFFMMDVSTFFWKNISTLQKFQFPWRFLTVSLFVSSLIAGFVMSKLPKKTSYLIMIILIPVVLIVNSEYFHPQSFLQKPDNFYSGVYNGTTDTGESAPKWSVRFMEKRPQHPIEVIDGKAQIEIKKRSSSKHTYMITADVRSGIRENTLYFPGWTVLVDGKLTKIEYQDQNSRGLITFYIEKGKHSVDVIFRETKLRIFANVISLLSAVSIIVLIIKIKYVQKS